MSPPVPHTRTLGAPYVPGERVRLHSNAGNYMPKGSVRKGHVLTRIQDPFGAHWSARCVSWARGAIWEILPHNTL